MQVVSEMEYLAATEELSRKSVHGRKGVVSL